MCSGNVPFCLLEIRCWWFEKERDGGEMKRQIGEEEKEEGNLLASTAHVA